MHCLSFLSRKGGCGKSTILTSLACAVAVEKEGMKVAVIDCDSGLDSTADFFELRGKADVVCERLGGDRNLYKVVEGFYDRGFDYCFIDIGGWDAVETRIAASFSGALIIPVVPSGNFYRGTDKTIETLNELAREGILKAKPHLLINKARRNTRALGLMRDAINDFDIPVFNTVLHELQDYTNADLDSMSIFDGSFKSGQAAGEIRRLLAEIKEME